MGIINRIEELHEALAERNLCKGRNNFEESIGVSHGWLTAKINKNNKCKDRDIDVNVGTVASIKEKYPLVSVEWLVMGEGKMFVEPSGNLTFDEAETTAKLGEMLSGRMSTNIELFDDEKARLKKQIERLEEDLAEEKRRNYNWGNRYANLRDEFDDYKKQRESV